MFADERPQEEERKSVRFDLEKEMNVKFAYSGSEEEDWNSESEIEEDTGLSGLADNNNKSSNSMSSLQKQLGDERSSKTTGRSRFVVENVTENEHLNSQLSRENSDDFDKEYLSGKFSKIKNIDLMSRSETDNSDAGNNTESRSSLLDEIRKRKEQMLENMKRSDERVKKQLEEDRTSHLLKLKHDLENVKRNREMQSKISTSKSFDELHDKIIGVHRRDIDSLKRDLERKLDECKADMERKFIGDRDALQGEMKERLRIFQIEMTQKEEREVESFINERTENLKRVKAELETCYDKDKQEMLANLNVELDEKRRELLELKNREMDKLRAEHETSLRDERLSELSEHEMRNEHNERIGSLKRELEKEFADVKAELRSQQREKIVKLTEEHEKCLSDILKDFKIDVSIFFLIGTTSIFPLT